MAEWKTVRLGTIASTNQETYSPKENWQFVNYLDTGNITMNRIDEVQHINTSMDKLPSRARRKVKSNSIIYSTVRPNQLHYGIIKEQPENFLVSTGFTVIDVNMEKAVPDYIYYVLTQKEITEHLQAIAEQSVSAYPSLKPSDIENLEVLLPDIDTQKATVAILGVIDEKIKQNTEINNNLSDLLQAIYQKQFDDVSLGANQGILSDICSYSKEKVAVSELNVNTYFSTENMLPEKAGSTKATSLPTTPQTTACRNGDTLISNIRPYFKKIVYCEDMCGCSTDVLCFTPVQAQYAAYLFSTLYTDKFFAFMVAGSKGTKMPRGDKQQIMTYPVVLPAESELEEFNAIAFPVLEQLNSNKAENKRLSALRDALLPKLMSGEIDISSIDL